MIINIADAADYMRLEEKVAKLRQVSGYDIDDLIDLFAAGFKLIPPASWFGEEKKDD